MEQQRLEMKTRKVSEEEQDLQRKINRLEREIAHIYSRAKNKQVELRERKDKQQRKLKNLGVSLPMGEKVITDSLINKKVEEIWDEAIPLERELQELKAQQPKVQQAAGMQSDMFG